MQREAKEETKQACNDCRVVGGSRMKRTYPEGVDTMQQDVCKRPRTRSSFNICHLSPELLVHIFKGVHIRDLLALKQVCHLFHEVIDTSTSLWSNASFFGSWPISLINLDVFNRAAGRGNFEASVKLAIAKLYNEGLAAEEQHTDIEEKALQATQYFCQAECQTSACPFTWLFIRPPWAANGLSCKSYVFEALKQQCEANQPQTCSTGAAAAAAVSIGTIFCLAEDYEEAAVYLEKAEAFGSDQARLMLWRYKYTDILPIGGPMANPSQVEFGRRLEAIRELRSIAVEQDNLQAKVWLCKFYTMGQYGGLTSTQAFLHTRHVFQASSPFNFQPILCPPHDLTGSMRYILIDWMVEVSTMKSFSSLSLQLAVTIVNRCLMMRDFHRAEVQLLGISAMVFCSRFWPKDIITIKEAAWLTDNTYTYSDVVRMMGEIIALLNGHVRYMTVNDFVLVLHPVDELSEQGRMLVDYVSELCLLQACMAKYSPARIAACCVLLARLLCHAEVAWPTILEVVTGYSLQDLTPCCFDIHEKCLLEGTQFDHRDYPMQAVKERYNSERCPPLKLDDIKIISHSDLKHKLGVWDPVVQKARHRLSLRQAEELICSPSRGKGRSRRVSERTSEMEAQHASRDEASTPPMDQGYEADYEDDTDPFDASYCSNRSDDSEYEPRTDPPSELPSEADPPSNGMSSHCKNRNIPGGISVSSPFAPQIRLSNCSCDSCRTSGMGTSPSVSNSFSQSPEAGGSRSLQVPCSNSPGGSLSNSGSQTGPSTSRCGDDGPRLPLGFSPLVVAPGVYSSLSSATSPSAACPTPTNPSSSHSSPAAGLGLSTSMCWDDGSRLSLGFSPLVVAPVVYSSSATSPPAACPALTNPSPSSSHSSPAATQPGPSTSRCGDDDGPRLPLGFSPLVATSTVHSRLTSATSSLSSQSPRDPPSLLSLVPGIGSSHHIPPSLRQDDQPLRSHGFSLAQFYGQRVEQAQEEEEDVGCKRIEDMSEDDSVSVGFSEADDLLSDADDRKMFSRFANVEEMMEGDGSEVGESSCWDPMSDEEHCPCDLDAAPGDDMKVKEGNSVRYRSLFGGSFSVLPPGFESGVLKPELGLDPCAVGAHTDSDPELAYIPDSYLIQYEQVVGGCVQQVCHVSDLRIHNVRENGLKFFVTCRNAKSSNILVHTSIIGGRLSRFSEEEDRGVSTWDDNVDCFFTRRFADYDTSRYGYLLHYDGRTADGRMVNVNVPLSHTKANELTACGYLALQVPELVEVVILPLRHCTLRPLKLAQLVDSSVGTSDDLQELSKGATAGSGRGGSGIPDDTVEGERGGEEPSSLVGDSAHGGSTAAPGARQCVSRDRGIVGIPRDRLEVGAGLCADGSLALDEPVAESTPIAKRHRDRDLSGRRQGLRSQAQVSLKFDVEEEELEEDGGRAMEAFLTAQATAPSGSDAHNSSDAQSDPNDGALNAPQLEGRRRHSSRSQHV